MCIHVVNGECMAYIKQAHTWHTYSLRPAGCAGSRQKVAAIELAWVHV